MRNGVIRVSGNSTDPDLPAEINSLIRNFAIFRDVL